MGFNSFGYILLFLPIVTLLCLFARQLPWNKAPQACVLLSSLVFYAWGKPWQLPYLVGSILANWLIARWMTPRTGVARTRILQLGLLLNVGYLCCFKYIDFFLSNLPYLVRRGIHAPELAFPLGISFFTLAQIMYLADCYESLAPPSGLFDHATFVSFFPYVISGPISRSKRILHQFPALNSRSRPTADIMARALYLFSLGLFKKVVLADAFSKLADTGFSNIESLSTIWAWVVATAYMLQLYFDFSGYSDMAIASGLFLGIEIPINFRAPLRSQSIIKFWQRWHITLSEFIASYLYTPILRSFESATLATSAIATVVSMSIAGLWHGPSWTYVAFGLIHGVGLACNQIWRKTKMPKLPGWFAWLLTILLLDLSFVFFRAPDIHTAVRYLPHLFSIRHFFGTQILLNKVLFGALEPIYILLQVGGIFAALYGKSTEQLSHEFKPTRLNFLGTAACLLTAFLFLNSNVAKPFIYFGF